MRAKEPTGGRSQAVRARHKGKGRSMEKGVWMGDFASRGWEGRRKPPLRPSWGRCGGVVEDLWITRLKLWMTCG